MTPKHFNKKSKNLNPFTIKNCNKSMQDFQNFNNARLRLFVLEYMYPYRLIVVYYSIVPYAIIVNLQRGRLGRVYVSIILLLQ